MNDRMEMLRQVFFDDPVADGMGFQLRELSRKIGLAPTSTKIYLKQLEKEGFIKVGKHRIHGYPVYLANRDGDSFRLLKRLNMIRRLDESGLIEYLYSKCLPDVIILFGSAAKGEDVKDSDIDIFMSCKDAQLDINSYERKIGRRVNIFFSNYFSRLSPELKNNIVNGTVLKGYLKVFK